MIYIWDNGIRYSGHEIVFIDTNQPGDLVRSALALLAYCDEYYKGAKILGTTQHIEWIEIRPMSLERWIKDYLWDFYRTPAISATPCDLAELIRRAME